MFHGSLSTYEWNVGEEEDIRGDETRRGYSILTVGPDNDGKGGDCGASE